MGFNIISAAEAATYIKHGYNVGLSGFTPAGSPKAVTPEIAKIAEAEHAAGRSFQIGIFTGASTGDSADGALIRAKALRYRAPYTTNADFRKAVNNGEVAYNDIHLSQMARIKAPSAESPVDAPVNIPIWYGRPAACSASANLAISGVTALGEPAGVNPLRPTLYPCLI